MTGTSWHVTAKSSIRNWVMLYKSGVYASRVTVLTPGGLPYAIASRLRLIAWLRVEQSTLTVWQKSAEGIVDISELTVMDEILWHCRETRQRQRKQTLS